MDTTLNIGCWPRSNCRIAVRLEIKFKKARKLMAGKPNTAEGKEYLQPTLFGTREKIVMRRHLLKDDLSDASRSGSLNPETERIGLNI